MLVSGFELSRKAVRERLIETENFEQALDLLAEFTADMGFTQTLYGYIPTTPQSPALQLQGQ
ncbi:hypothetical protein OE766_27565 [Pararhizobium sp. YC-54]|uniref:hypothetical protein n=1 Tax=Pararhizobium sp. YC-54 TaxID=2986920 RepID=UPI0021F6A6F2|nr:hypothetical protein [Pararhizobium sp. YC-54]MCW0001971.1 hypothetical protein [Pararhizobium sp. YC-54]